MPVLIVALLALGCSAPPTEELVTMTVAGTAKVDVLCVTGGCDTAPWVEATLVFNEKLGVPLTATYKVEQYRVDYVVPGYENIPFFADVSNTPVAYRETVTFSANVAGDTQRDFFVDSVGSDPLHGVATLTTAGRDWRGVLTQMTAEFPIEFGEYESEVPDSGGTP